MLRHKIFSEVRVLAWVWRSGPWPGRGPFSHLPPWQRPGWLFGRGWCGWLPSHPWIYAGSPRVWAYVPYAPPTYPALDPPQALLREELAALEDYKKKLGEEEASIEARIKELKSRLEKGEGRLPEQQRS
ncbi:MAG: hypothetical protein QFX33_00885 [Candidatus Nezhaarchaeota archaeon]|nr:hypothetical protein [Candidatus Nezhaarchaeota archaeon]